MAINAFVLDDSGVMPIDMGAERAIGLPAMKASGFPNLAQGETSGVVHGMPGEAVKIGAVEQVMALLNFPRGIIRALEGTNKSNKLATKGGSL